MEEEYININQLIQTANKFKKYIFTKQKNINKYNTIYLSALLALYLSLDNHNDTKLNLENYTNTQKVRYNKYLNYDKENELHLYGNWNITNNINTREIQIYKFNDEVIDYINIVPNMNSLNDILPYLVLVDTITQEDIKTTNLNDNIYGKFIINDQSYTLTYDQIYENLENEVQISTNLLTITIMLFIATFIKIQKENKINENIEYINDNKEYMQDELIYNLNKILLLITKKNLNTKEDYIDLCVALTEFGINFTSNSLDNNLENNIDLYIEKLKTIISENIEIINNYENIDEIRKIKKIPKQK